MNSAAGSYHAVGLKADGTVVAVGRNGEGLCNVSDWRDIVAIAAGSDHTVGLKADGTVVAVGLNANSQCAVSGWKLFNSVDTIKEEQEAAQKAAEEARIAREKAAEAARIAEEARQAAIARKNAAIAEKRCAIAALQAERSKLGLLDGKKKKEIDAQIAALAAEIRKL